MALRKVTTLLVLHVTATPLNRNIGVAEVRAMHKAQGWSDIGYGELIRLGGKLENGRGIDQVGAHVAGFNSTSAGIALVGGLGADGRPADTMTPEQEGTLLRRLRELLVIYPDAKICGHRDLSPDRDGDGIIEPGEHLKACPCFDAIPWATRNGLPGADIKGVWGGEIYSVASANGKPPVKVAGPDARQVYLQKLLSLSGLQFGPIDGIVGQRTADALEEYQKRNGLPASRQFDAATVAMLRAAHE